MEEKKDNRGGKREGAGRKGVAEEAKVNAMFATALRKMYAVGTDEEAKELFVQKTLMESQRGQLFIAEHLFGKPKETIDQNVNINSFTIKDALGFDSTKR